MPIVDTPRTIDLTAFNGYWTFSPSSGIIADGPNRPFLNTAPPSAPNFAFIQNLGTMEQAFTTTVGGVHTIAGQSENCWFPEATQKVFVYVDGVGVGTVQPNNGFHWSPWSFSPNIPIPGPHTLRFVGVGIADKNVMMFLDSVTITGPGGPVPLLNPAFDGYLLSPDGIVANPPVTSAPSLRVDATVTTSGKLIKFVLKPIAGGDPINSGSINQAPTVQINGVGVGSLRTSDADGPILSTSVYSPFLVPMPAGVAAGPNDVVTLTAPAGWIYGPSGYSEAMSAQIMSNRAGRSFVRLADVPRTMWMGIGYSHLHTAEWHSGLLPRNQAKRTAYWQPYPISTDAHGNPTVLNGPAMTGPIVKLSGLSFIETPDTGCPTPPGYWAVRYDDQDGHSSASLTNNGAGNTSCTEITSIGNPGVGGVGIVRVFDFQPTGIINTTPPTFEHLTDLQVWLRLATTNPRDTVRGGNPINIANVAVLAPGDFTWAPNTPTVIPPVTWDEVAATVMAKTPANLPFGPHRCAVFGIKLAESSACEREDVVKPDDFHWAQDAQRLLDIAYVQARPWTNANSPYIYDPLTGPSYEATLAAAITTAPAAGTIETITLAQVGDGLIFAGLVLTIDNEKMRVMSAPSGSPTSLAVSVMRGVESTTPALHPLVPPTGKPISVRGRFSMADLAAFGPGGRQVTELVTQFPHGLKTGMIVDMVGDGWPPFIYTDGIGFRGGTFGRYSFVVWVTGPSSFVTIGTAITTNPANTTLSTTYTLDPGPESPTHPYVCRSPVYLPEYGGLPYEYAATLAAKHPGVPALVSFCMVASDDMVDSIFRDRILPYLPADRDLYFELADEPWNTYGTPGSYWFGMSYLLYGLSGPSAAEYWYGVRVGQIRARGRAVWAAAGRDPSHVKSTLNFQTAPGNAGAVAPLLDFLAVHSAVPDMLEIAPYYDTFPDLAIWKTYAKWETDMLVDEWIFDVYENSSPGGSHFGGGQVHRTGDYKVAIDAWNLAQTPPGNVRLGIYEYSTSVVWPQYLTSSSDTGGLGAAMDATTTTLVLPNANVYPPFDDRWDDCRKVCPGTWLHVDNEWMTVVSRSGTNCTVNRGQGGTTAVPHAAETYLQNDWIEGTRDIILHPNFRFAHRDTLEFFQFLGAELLTPTSLNQEWSGGAGWADYHAIDQLPGKGDGSDGKFNNLLCLARPGQPHTKSPTVNQDANTVSPKGQAMIDFLTPTGGPGPDGARRPVVIHRRRGRLVAR